MRPAQTSVNKRDHDQGSTPGAQDSTQFGTLILEIVRRPVLGPLIFGLLVGGIPLGFAFGGLAGRMISPELVRLVLNLSPVAVSVIILGTLLGVNLRWREMIYRAFIVGAAECVPIPATVCVIVAHNWGYEMSSPSNFLVLILIFLFWSIILTGPSWLLALALLYLKNRWIAAVSTPPTRTP
jgi:hypothetical protein